MSEKVVFDVELRRVGTAFCAETGSDIMTGDAVATAIPKAIIIRLTDRAAKQTTHIKEPQKRSRAILKLASIGNRAMSYTNAWFSIKNNSFALVYAVHNGYLK